MSLQIANICNKSINRYKHVETTTEVVIEATKMQKLNAVGSRANKEYIKQRRLRPRGQIKCIPREAHWLWGPQDGGLVQSQAALGNL